MVLQTLRIRERVIYRSPITSCQQLRRAHYATHREALPKSNGSLKDSSVWLSIATLTLSRGTLGAGRTIDKTFDDESLGYSVSSQTRHVDSGRQRWARLYSRPSVRLILPACGGLWCPLYSVEA